MGTHIPEQRKQQVLAGLKDLAHAINAIEDSLIEHGEDAEGLPWRHAGGLIRIASRMVHEHITFFSNNEDDRLLHGAVANIHAAFGAPGDWGYGTPIGKALRTIYNC